VESHTTAPVAVLRARNDASRAALGEHDVVRITHFPFNVGRESRAAGFEKLKRELDRRLGHAPPLNDFYLIDRSDESGRHVSREHFRIDFINGRLVLVDRNSRCGTIVSGRKVGVGQPTNDIELQDGDTITVGTDKSPYVFTFQTEM